MSSNQEIFPFLIPPDHSPNFSLTSMSCALLAPPLIPVDFGDRSELSEETQSAYDTCTYSVPEVERITRVAAQIALAVEPPLPITSVDKANVLATSRLWRKTVTSVLEKEYPQIKLSHQLVDSAAMIMVASPRKLNGVILTENMFGDM